MRTGPNATGTLVGRDAELDTFDTIVAELGAGRGGCLFISGEPGIGKSSLVTYLAEQAGQSGARAYWGYCWEAGGAPAYWPWTQLLRGLAADLTLDPVPGLAQVLPEWLDPSAERLTLQPDQARFALLEAARGLLTSVSRDQPLLLILEDLHGADADSLQLLAYLARHVHHLPIVLAGTFRDTEARTSPATEPLWQATRGARLLHPGRFGSAEIARFLEQRTGAAPNPEDVDRLLTVTEGNPLFLKEMLELVGSAGLFDERLPDSVQQVIAGQVRRLPEDVTSLLLRAAIIGREFSVDELALLAARDPADIVADLSVAVELGGLERIGGDRYRFFHGLCCDVLRAELLPREREGLHRDMAELIQADIDRGSVDRLGERAMHLAHAGTEQRQAAVAAWRAAARRATERQAFDEAVRALRNALACFGAGPRFSPLARCQLVLELAAATLTQGDIDAGQALCREAFQFARTVGDPGLMAEAALTYGRAIVVAKVDQDLVDALTETLAALPPDDAATRARVSARLAGALQPAPNPAEPLEMARDAIALARSTSDDAVVYEVLRSAVSAMMDFAPAAERVPLNREFGALAARFGSAPDQFRSSLRLVIDAAELGDRELLHAFVRDAAQLAHRIGLPHYQWRVASLEALQATITGDFTEAVRQLDRAERLAGEIDEHAAMLTLSIQRLLIVQDWAAPEAPDFDSVRASLDAALERFPAARFYVRPLFASYLSEADSRALLENQALVERIIVGRDRFTLCRLGELAARAGDVPVLARTYEALEPFADQCATMGLMGSGWGGPVADVLGLMATAAGRHDAAAAHFRQALDICARMGALPAETRVLQHCAALERARGDTAAAEATEARTRELTRRLALKAMPALGDSAEQDLLEPGAADAEPGATPASTRVGGASEPPPSDYPDAGARPAPGTRTAPADRLVLSRDGEVWRVEFGGAQALLKPSRGLELLARLVAAPDREIHVLDLVGPATDAPRDGGDAGPLLDAQAREAYRARIEALEAERDDAQALGDADRADTAQSEIDFIARELAGAFGLGGRARPSGRAAERARVNVQRRLRDAIRRIGRELPAAGAHLDAAVKTGTYCRYQPL